jgi:hypothetical protein
MVWSSLVDITYVPPQCGFPHLMVVLTPPIIHLYGEVVKSGKDLVLI